MILNTADNESRTILVVDDEDAVLQVIREMLERLGYRVLAAETGSQAIELVKTFGGVIDLAIVDMCLPDMRGETVYARISDLRPDSKIVISSGYTRQDVARKLNIEGANFIQKPFSFFTLSSMLKKILETVETE